MTQDEIWNTYYTKLLANLHSITGDLMAKNADSKETVILIARTYGFYLSYVTSRPEDLSSYSGSKNSS
jgi:hypothetical protein